MNPAGTPSADVLAQGVQDMSLGTQHKARRRNLHAYHDFSAGVEVPQPAQAGPVPGQASTSGGLFVPGQAAPESLGRHQRPMTEERPQQAAHRADNGGFQGVDVSANANSGQPSESIRSFRNVNSVPALVEDRAFAQESLGPAPLYKTFESASPPPAGTDYRVEDQGISGPNFCRLSMYNVPNSEQLRKSTALPLGMIVRPFAERGHRVDTTELGDIAQFDADAVPIVDFSGIEVPRCRRCRAYINPSMVFVEGGTKFICNMCQYANVVSAEYYEPTDASSRRINWKNSPELAFGTYDLVVSPEYWKTEGVSPKPLRHLFLIDVTKEAIKREVPKIAAEAIRLALYGSANEPSAFPRGAEVAIATYNKSVHFYNLSARLEQPQMIVMNDITDAFVPLETGLFVDPVASQVAIEQLLDRIDLLFADSYDAEPVYGAALEVALQSLQKTGGRVTALLCSLPTWGPGNLHFRESTHRTLESERDLFLPSMQYYINMGLKYAQAGVGLDLFAVPSTYVDLANVGEVARLSGGQSLYYPHFVPQRDGKKLIAELYRSVTGGGGGEIGTQALFKVRCSNGLQVAAYYGNFAQPGSRGTGKGGIGTGGGIGGSDASEDPVFGVVNYATTIGVLFTYDGKLDTKLDAHFQSAMLYTSANGQRRVRVTNTITAVSEQFKPVLNFVDVDSCLGILSRELITRIGTKQIKDLREGIDTKLIEVFSQYRTYAGQSLPPTMLLMPISLRSLPIYGLALQKSRPLRDSSQISSDTRVNAIRSINTMDADELAVYLYPRIIGLHNLRPEDCTWIETTGDFVMPQNIQATSSAVEEGSAYLVYNGQMLVLWLQKNVSPLLLKDLFGVDHLDHIDPYINALPDIDTDISRKTRALIAYFARKERLRTMTIQIARQGLDGADFEFASSMVEDRILDAYKYTDYVTHIHRNSKRKE